ncbi:MAG: glycoside hydrolase family 2 [Clostridia bacterium]|nr:glycoside hydrolase family 2 [Clostridia bacterium]
MKTISLNGIWSLSGRVQEGFDCGAVVENIEAQVPGCVQLDLSRAGILPADLYMGDNITKTEEFENWEWWYTRTFDSPAERENVYLVFEGVDCVAEYFLNGVKFGESENALIAHEFEIGKYLCDGENTLTVHILSPIVEAHKIDFDVHTYETWNGYATDTALRRPAHSYGWDIMPRAVTSGLWRDVRVEVRDEISFSQIYCRTTDRSCELFYELKLPFALLSGVEIEFEGACGESKFYARKNIKGARNGHLSLNIRDPKRWMPYGYGDANVYDGEARIYRESRLVHTESFSFGLRTVKLERTEITDGENGCFRFLVNGVEIMCKGSNWVPMDAFHSRDAERYAAALEIFKDLGCNIIRCWGGNVYEDHAFFDFCDRNGIMVWQDFSMACHAYPQDERYERLIKDEATAVVRKLRNHPSIILWSGDNEIDCMYASAGIDPAINVITREWLPDVIKRNDLDRPYLPSSPYVSPEVYENYSTEKLPEEHRWGPRDYYKSDFYRNCRAHFISESGYHGCPSAESIKKFITPERVWPYQNNPEWILHSSDQNGNDSRVMLMDKQVHQLFGEVPTDMEDYILASQISQAEAKKYFIERMRVGRPQKSGIIWWNALDGWPQMSDAIVDYYYNKKLAYHYVKASQKPFIIAADEITSWRLPIVACNDTLEAVSGRVKVSDAESGEILLECAFSAAPNTSTRVSSIPIFYSEQRFLIIEWETSGGESGRNHYLCGYPAISFERYKRFLESYLKED